MQKTGVVCHTHKLKTKGFGFIDPVTGDGNVFFHTLGKGNKNVKDLTHGQAVTYTECRNAKGLFAEDIVPLAAPIPALSAPSSHGKTSTLDAGAFLAAALASVPADDWCRTWAADRTIMLRMTSKTVKELVDKLLPPAVVKLSRSLCDGGRAGTAGERMKNVLSELEALPARMRITTLALTKCDMKGQDAERLAGVLAQCPALAHLDLGYNQIGDEGAGSIAGVLSQCPLLSHLHLWCNGIGAPGAERLAGVLAHCPLLSYLNLAWNELGDEGAGALAGVLPHCPALVYLDLQGNQIGDAGAEKLADVLTKCPALALKCAKLLRRINLACGGTSETSSLRPHALVA